MHLIPGGLAVASHHHVQSDGQWVVIPQKILFLPCKSPFSLIIVGSISVWSLYKPFTEELDSVILQSPLQLRIFCEICDLSKTLGHVLGNLTEMRDWKNVCNQSSDGGGCSTDELSSLPHLSVKTWCQYLAAYPTCHSLKSLEECDKSTPTL